MRPLGLALTLLRMGLTAFSDIRLASARLLVKEKGEKMRDTRPIYGPWRIYSKEEENAMIIASLARENDFNRRWNERHGYETPSGR